MREAFSSEALFRRLDVDGDGRISASDLRQGARRLGWHWQEAPLYAAFHLLALSAPLSLSVFQEALAEMAEDPQGPYGRVLLRTHALFRPALAADGKPSAPFDPGSSDENRNGDPPPAGTAPVEQTPANGVGGGSAAGGASREDHPAGPAAVSIDEAVLLIIDPQRSFSEGAWMHSIGPEAESDTAPIRAAFGACAAAVAKTAGRLESAFTRCPFPPGSYGWDRRLAGVIADDAPYFLKPGNSVLFPPSNGFASWLEGCIERGRRTLVIGGCTLNSCVRVSSVQVRRRFAKRGLQVVVDLSLCGARARNYRPSGRYRGDSAVAAAVSQMTADGVRAVGRVRWG